MSQVIERIQKYSNQELFTITERAVMRRNHLKQDIGIFVDRFGFAQSVGMEEIVRSVNPEDDNKTIDSLPTDYINFYKKMRRLAILNNIYQLLSEEGSFRINPDLRKLQISNE